MNTITQGIMNKITPEMTTRNQVHFRQTGVDDIAFISTHIEGEYVEASITRPRSGEYTEEEMLHELQEKVWWKNITE